MQTRVRLSFATGALVPLLVAVSSAGTVYAQGAEPLGGVVGTVRDSTGAGLVGAELSVVGTDLRTRSDESGAFRLTNVRRGTAALRVRRLGFRPTTVEVTVDSGANAPVKVTLARLAQELTPVLVRADRRRYTGPFADFYERRDRGFGRFITRADIERRNPMMFTDLLRQIPGVHLVSTPGIDHAVRIRGNSCAPLIWVDGMPLSKLVEFDLDALSPQDIEGIEVYSGISTVPVQFQWVRGEASCGAIVIWSRQGELRPKKRTVDLAQLVAALEVFTADQVDTVVRADTASPAAPMYPDSLRGAGVGGLVVAEFVVDTTGGVEMDTFGVVSSSHPAFTDAVRRALTEARFRPAWRAGRTVRQVVQEPFRFVAGRGAEPRGTR
jgi:TonB family protein